MDHEVSDLFERLAVEPTGVMLLATAEETGLLDLLGEAGHALEDLSEHEVASRLGLALRPTTLFLEALADVGIVRRIGTGFRLAPVLQACWAADHGPSAPESVQLLTRPGSAYYQFYHLLHTYRGQRRWARFPEVLRTGIPPAGRSSDDRDLRYFVCAMGNRLPEVVSRTVQACLHACPEARRVLDLGGGPGFIAGEFARNGCQAVLQDQPDVLELNRRQGRTWPGVTFFPGDFLQVLPDGPFDLVYLGNVTHIYGAEENASLFRRLGERQPPGGVVVINDYVWGRSPEARLFALRMLLATERGGVWTEAQYRSWLEQAGYEDVRVEDRPGAVKQFVLARRAGHEGRQKMPVNLTA